MTKRRGFSLLTVLIIAILGMFLLGGALSLYTADAGASRQAVGSDLAYNMLVGEAEKAKAALKLEMSSRKTALVSAKHMDIPRSLSDLEVLRDDGSKFWTVDKPSVMVGGRKGRLSVKVYDSLYLPDQTSSIPPHERRLLPPAVQGLNTTSGGGVGGGIINPGTQSVGGGNSDSAGVYLIRATLKFSGDEERGVEVSVTQNANPGAP